MQLAIYVCVEILVIIFNCRSSVDFFLPILTIRSYTLKLSLVGSDQFFHHISKRISTEFQNLVVLEKFQNLESIDASNILAAKLFKMKIN